MINTIKNSPCSLLRRFGCMLYDAIILLAIFFAITAIAVGLRGGEAIQAGNIGFQLALLLCAWFYFSWCWQHGAQTIGMRAWRVYLISSGPINQKRCALRFLVACVSFIALGLGFFTAVINPARLTWHDRFSDSWLERHK